VSDTRIATWTFHGHSAAVAIADSGKRRRDVWVHLLRDDGTYCGLSVAEIKEAERRDVEWGRGLCPECLSAEDAA